MSNKRYVLKLTAEERQELERLTRRGVAAAGKVTRARALLLCDAGESGPAWTDARIAEPGGHGPQPGELAEAGLRGGAGRVART